MRKSPPSPPPPSPPPAPPSPLLSRFRPSPTWGLPALVAAAAFVAVVCAIDPAGDYPHAGQGPGLTLDEWFNVQQGVRTVTGLKGWALGSVSLREIFGDPRDLPNPELGYHNPDHPPLGRFWLGVWHDLAAWLAPPAGHEGPFVTACARVGSAAAFALTVFLCGWMAAKWYGTAAGTIAAVAVVLMPRVFGHAHLAALESCIGLAYAAAVLTVAQSWDRDGGGGGGGGSGKSPSSRSAALAGMVLGAAMLTKIQGALIPIPVAIWAFSLWRWRAMRPLLIWGAVALATFFLLWPWLWMGEPGPVGRFLEYLGRTKNRAVLYVWYFGERYADRDVPWHYPAVFFVSTVPLGLQILGALGLFAGPNAPWAERRGQLVLGSILFPLVLFSIPGVAVYDGARLFLVVFPLWGLIIGRGWQVAWDGIRRRLSHRAAATVAVCFLALQGWGIWAVWPCFLSYYNVGVGGLRGAERLGLEIDYWGEGVTRDLLERVIEKVPEGATVDVSPVLDDFQLKDLLIQSPLLRRRGIILHAYSDDAPGHADYLLVFRRMADVSPPLRDWMRGQKPLAEVRRDGVLLAGLYHRGAVTGSAP